jgi:hypothetical protein
MDEKKRPTSITFLLLGLVLLVMGAGLFAAFAPVFRCQRCAIDFAMKKGITHLRFPPEPPTLSGITSKPASMGHLKTSQSFQTHSSFNGIGRLPMLIRPYSC